MEFQAPEKSAMLNWKFKVTTMANSVDFQEGFPQILGSSHADWSQLLLYCYLYLVPKQKRREAYIHNYSSLLPTVQVFLSRSLDAPAFHPLMLGNSLCIRPAGQSEALELPQEKRKKAFSVVVVNSVRSPNTSMWHYKHCYILFTLQCTVVLYAASDVCISAPCR